MTKTAKKPGKAAARGTPKSGIKVLKHDKYPLVPLDAIHIVERPKDEKDERLFYNARGEEDFNDPDMEELRNSIRVDGLLEPLVGRPVYKNGDSSCLLYVELIAGERRARNIRAIIENDLPCYDEDAPKPKTFAAGVIVVVHGRFGTVVEHDGKTVKVAFDDKAGKEESTVGVADVLPTVLGSKLYTHVPCKLVNDCTDERAMRLNFTENKNSKPLAVKDEIALIERLVRRGIKQEEIADMLVTNVTFVSQTASFRTQLPPEAFEKLLEGKMARNVAVNLLSYAAEDRPALYQLSVAEQERETAAKVNTHRAEQERHEDDAEVHSAEAKKLTQAGDLQGAAREERKAASSEGKADKAKQRRQRAESEAGTLKQGHVQRGAAKGGLTPRKAKMLPREQIDEKFIKDMTKYCTEDLADPITGEDVPCELASIVRRTALAIINGQYDGLAPIRDYMVENGRWTLPEETQAGKAETAAKKGGKGGKATKGRVTHKDEDEDEEDEPDGEDEEALDDDELDDDELDPRHMDDDDDGYDDDYDDDDDRSYGGRGFNSEAFDKEWN
jgi:ParB-like chromosome segregation protein Spo0J